MGVTEELIAFVLETRFEDLPNDVVDRAKVLIFDFVGGALSGLDTRAAVLLTEYVAEMAARPESGVIGKNFKTTAGYAAYLNGVFNHATEMESVSQLTTPNVLPVIAVSLAVGEKRGLSGKKVLEGFILGFEVQARVGGASLASTSKRGRISIFNHLGTSTAAAKLMNLDRHQAKMALGIAAFQAGGLITTAGTTAHVLELPVSGRDGIEAAELAKKGATAPPDILETPQGFLDALVDRGGFDIEKMTRDLGKTFQIVEPGLSMKKYPCCNRAQRALDALFDMMAEHQVSYNQIEKVIVDINLYDSYLMKYPDPKTGDEAKFSFPHILGAAILRGRVWVDSFTDESATDHALGGARKKIKVIIHPDWPLGRAEARTPVTVKLKDGKVITKEVAASSEPTMEQLINRYKEGAQRVYSSDQAEKCIELLLNLEKLKNVSELMNLLTFTK